MKRPLPVPGICDGCGQTYKLADLKWEYVLGRSTGMRKCKACLDPSHPQLDTRNVKTSDKQSVLNSRSDYSELEDERRLFAFNPVGCEGTSTATIGVGKVNVVALRPTVFVEPTTQTATASVGNVSVATNQAEFVGGQYQQNPEAIKLMGYIRDTSGTPDMGTASNLQAIPADFSIVNFVDVYFANGSYSTSRITFLNDVRGIIDMAQVFANGVLVLKNPAFLIGGRTVITYSMPTFVTGKAILAIV